MIFCLIELCPQPSAQDVTFISDTDLHKNRPSAYERSFAFIVLHDNGVSLR